MSGHIFFNDKWYGFDDGVYSGARIIELISKTKKSVSNLNKELPILFSTHELNIEVLFIYTDTISGEIMDFRTVGFNLL